MKQTVTRQIIGCLAVRGTSNESLAPLETFSRSRWEQVVNWLDLSGLTLFFWDRLKALEGETLVPPEVRKRLDRVLCDNRLRVTAMAKESIRSTAA